MRPDERWSTGAIADYQLSDTITVYGEFMFNSNATRGQIAESGTFFAEEYLFVDNSLFPQAFQILCRNVPG